ARISAESANIPEERRKLVTSHDTFGYFSEAYGYEIVGTGLPSFTTEAADPAAGETAELVEEIRASGVPAIFTENISNPALMEQIARESDVELAPTLYTDALGEAGTEGDTYIDMMNYNIDVITKSLGG
ncbi:MAG: metal ABC transporter solute-binding protein, Zn/Mn family, partial [Rubrobacter sp.]